MNDINSLHIIDFKHSQLHSSNSKPLYHIFNTGNEYWKKNNIGIALKLINFNRI